LRTFSLTAAGAAADAWNSGTNFDMTVNGCAGCVGRQTASQCAVWCYSGTLVGSVSRNDISSACLCPPQGSFVGTWN
jgi:hypothetical protein